MMKAPLKISFMLAALCPALAVTGCVSFGNTHALITPVGVAGIHSFKPDAGDIQLPPQRSPDRVAANRQQTAQDEET